MKSITLAILALSLLTACSVGVNGVGVSAGKTYFSPYSVTQEDTAVVYVYWNQRDIERYLPFGSRKPKWNTFVNRKKNAELEEGTYSVVEVKAGKVRIEARQRIGSNSGISDQPTQVGLTAKAGETYFVFAQLTPGSTGVRLELQREISEREAYNRLYGMTYQENLQESMLY